MKRNARQSNRPVIPYDVIEILKIESNVINTPAAMTDPGIAYPEDDIAMNGLQLEVPRKLRARIMEIPTVNAEARRPNKTELISAPKFSINAEYSLRIAQSII